MYEVISAELDKTDRLLYPRKGKAQKLGLISIDGGKPLNTIELPATANIDAGITSLDV